MMEFKTNRDSPIAKELQHLLRVSDFLSFLFFCTFFPLSIKIEILSHHVVVNLLHTIGTQQHEFYLTKNLNHFPQSVLRVHQRTRNTNVPAGMKYNFDQKYPNYS